MIFSIRCSNSARLVMTMLMESAVSRPGQAYEFDRAREDGRDELDFVWYFLFER